MPLEQEYYSLFNTRIEFNNHTVINATEVGVELMVEFSDRTPGMSGVRQRIKQITDAKMTVKAFDAADMTLADLPPGLAVTELTFNSTESGTPGKLPSEFFTKYPADSWCVGPVKATYNKDNAQWELELIPNVLNAAEAV